MEVKIQVPDSLADITVGQYQEWARVIDQQEWTPIREKMITVSIFCHVGIDTIESISLKDLNSIYKSLSELLEGAFQGGLVKVIKIKGKRYGFHPDLENMTGGEWADLEEEIIEQGTVFKALPQILSILYRPIIPKKWFSKSKGYEIEKYTADHIKNAELMKGVDLQTASGLAVFFWTLAEQSGESFLQSIQKDLEMRKN